MCMREGLVRREGMKKEKCISERWYLVAVSHSQSVRREPFQNLYT